MARLWQSGFENNSVTSGHEWNTITGSPTISTSTKRTGASSGRISSLSSGSEQSFRTSFSASANGPFYFRVCLYIATLPSADNTIMRVDSAAGSRAFDIVLTSTGTLKLLNSGGTLVGSASSALSTATWYRIEMKGDASGAGATDTVEAKIDGAVFSTASNVTLTQMARLRVGGNIASEAQTVGDWFFDDVAINDTTGSAQTGYPGPGAILRLVPTAAGDANAWSNTANGAGASTNWQLVDENPPNDATDMVQTGTLNNIDMYNVTDSGLTVYDNIQVVAIGGRFRNNTADATTSFRFRVEKTSGGTIAESADIIPNATTFRTNGTDTNIRNFPLVTYADPDTAQWTFTTVDSMQIGLKLTAANVNRIQVTAIWASVDYIPGVAGGSFVPKIIVI